MSTWEEYSEILDNKEFTVEKRANHLATGSDSVKIAVGYFFIGGFDLIAENLEDANSIQLLIGRQTNLKTIEGLKQAFAEGLDGFDKEEAEDGVRNIYKLSQLDQVEIKVFSESNQRFHPKLYLYKYPEDNPHVKTLGHAIVGSSNLSASGLTKNIELNVEKTDSHSIRHLDAWFDDLWEQSDPFSPELMKEIFADSQFQDTVKEVDKDYHSGSDRTPIAEADVLSPYEATQRLIVEQFPEEVDEGTLIEDITGEYEDQLVEFQQDAVRAARQPLEKYNGVILADSVGLGKSYIGAPLVQEGTTEQDNVLIIGPNRLEDMWMEKMFGEKQSTKEPEFDLRANATYISFSKLSRLSEEDIQRYRTYDFVLIDEAHKLRNRGTKRYAKLQAIGRQGKKFVCLTATPVQNSARDVDNLIKVFADDSDFDIELMDQPSEIFREYDRLSNKPDDDITDAERRRLGKLRKQIEKIMREVVISRDRKFIIDTYGEDISVAGRRIKVPKRYPQKVTPNDPGLEDLYSDLVTVVAGALDNEDDTGLNLPYVVAERYDRDHDDEDELTLEYQSTTMLLAINLLKRLESSIAAFEASLETLIEREKATKMIAEGNFSDARNREQAIAYIQRTLESFEGEIEIEEVVEAVDAMKEHERKQLIADIEDDLENLEMLQKRAKSVLSAKDSSSSITGGNRDSKAATLKEKLAQELMDEKVILFSQFVPTIEHLFETLTGVDPDRRQVASFDGDEDVTIAYVHGNKFEDRLIDRFAPQGRKPDTPVGVDEEIDILLSTDVISEGQNLQDARNLVNYDLHWNPMLMEQRIGRIDRITTQHDELHIYNFVPIGDLRKHLGLLERLETKIRRVADSIGYSAPIIDSAEERVQKAFMIYENLDEADFSDEEFEGIGSKYDELRRHILSFCEENEVTIDEIQTMKADTAGINHIQYFAPQTTDEPAYMALTRLWFSTGRTEWRTTLFNKNNLASVTLGDQTKFQDHPRLGRDEVEIFELIANADNTRYPLPEGERDDIEIFAGDIDSSNTWETEIFAEADSTPSTIIKMEKFCKRVAEDDSYGKETTQKAKDILRQLSGGSVPGVERMEMSDYAENELDQIYRKRTRYGYKGVIKRLHQKLTKDIELVPPERVTDVNVVIFGNLE